MKRNAKRMLAIALSLCMTVSVCQTSFVAAADVGETTITNEQQSEGPANDDSTVATTSAPETEPTTESKVTTESPSVEPTPIAENTENDATNTGETGSPVESKSDEAAETAVAKIEGSTGDTTTYDTLQAAVDAASDGATIVLLKDVDFGADAGLQITKNITLDGGNGFTIKGASSYTIQVATDGVSLTLRGIIVQNSADNGHAVETQGANQTLILDNATVETIGESNTAAIAVLGSSTDKTNITIENNSTVKTGNAGYGIFTKNPVTLNVSDSAISGYAALYFKEGSAGSEVTIENSTVSGENPHAAGYSDFGTICFEADNINLSIKDSDLSASCSGGSNQALFLFNPVNSGTEFTKTKITISGGKIELTDAKNLSLKGTASLFSGAYDSVISAIKIEGIDVDSYLGDKYTQDTDGTIKRAVAKLVYDDDYTKYTHKFSSLDTLWKTIEEKSANPSIDSPVSASIELLGDTTLSEKITVSKNEIISLDLNGHTITNAISATEAYRMFTVYGTMTVSDGSLNQVPTVDDDGNVTYTSGKIIGGDYTNNKGAVSVFAVSGNGSLIVNSGTIEAEYAGIYIREADDNGASVTVTGGYVHGEHFGIVVLGNGNPNSATLTVSGNAVVKGDTEAGISGNGTLNDNKTSKFGGTNITISGGTVLSNMTEGSYIPVGIYQPNEGSLTITGGTVQGCTGVEIRAGELTVSGTTAKIIGGTDGEVNPKKNSNGPTTTNAALAIAQHTTKKPITVTISGGTFTGAAAVNEANPEGNSAEDISKITLAIKGGTFNGTVSSEDCTSFITGGTFSVDPTKYCAEGYSVEGTSEGSFEVVGQYEVEMDGTEYRTLQNAIDDIKANNSENKPRTIKLLKNITLDKDALILIEGKGSEESPITIDLNGKTIRGNNTNAVSSTSNHIHVGILQIKGSNVVLTDNSGTKGSIINEAATASGATISIIRDTKNEGCLKIENGVNIEFKSTGLSGAAFYLQKESDSETYKDAKLIINDANICTKKKLFYVGTNAKAIVEINGGTFEVDYTSSADLSNSFSKALTIKGGTFINYNIRSSVLQRIPDGYYALYSKEGGKYKVEVTSEEPTDYVAHLIKSKTEADTQFAKAYFAFDSLENIKDIISSNDFVNPEIDVKKDASIDLTGYGDAKTSKLTLNLADGVTLSGRITINNAEIIIKGGTVAENFSVKPVDSESYFVKTVKNEEENTITYSRSPYPVDVDGTKYETLQEAIDAIEAVADSESAVSKTITLLQDITISNNAPIQILDKGSNVEITLDLNGHTISGSSTAAATSKNGGVLQIKGSKVVLTDSSTGTKGSIVNTSTTLKGYAIAVYPTTTNEGSLTINGGVFVKTTSTNTACGAILANGLGTSGYQEVKVLIEDVNVETNGYIYYANIPANVSTTITGGTFTGTADGTQSSFNGAASLKISKGTFINCKIYSGLLGCIAKDSNVLYSIAEDTGIYTATVMEKTPEDYTAHLVENNNDASIPYSKAYFAFDELSKIKEALSLYSSQFTNTVIDVVKDASLNLSEYGPDSGKLYSLTLNLAGGVKLSGTITLKNADIVINGDTDSNNLAVKAADEIYTFTEETEGTKTTYSGRYYLAEVNGEKCITLQDAINKAKDGEETTVILLANVTGTVTIPTNKVITLDLSGHTLQYTSSAPVKVSGKLTVEDSSVSAAPLVGDDYSVTYTSGKIQGGYSAATILVADGGQLVVKSGSICSPGSYGIEVKGNSVPAGDAIESSVTMNGGYIYSKEFGIRVLGNGASLTVNDGVIVALDNAAVGGNGTNKAGETYRGTTINIDGGTLISRISSTGYIACGIYHPQQGTLNITDGKIIAIGGVGVLMRGGTLDMTGGTIIASGTASGKVGDSKIVLNCYGIQLDGDSGYYDYANSKVTISGGSVTAAKGVDALNVTAETDETAASKMSVSGGTFSTAVPEAYCAEGYTPVDKGDGTYTVAKYICEISDGTSYETLQEAIDAIKDSKETTIKLLSDTTITAATTIPEGKNIILDLNGKTLTLIEKVRLHVTGTLTVKSLSGETAKITSPDIPFEVNKGKLVLDDKNVTVESTGSYGVYVTDDGIVEVNGATVTAKYAALAGNNTTGNMNFVVESGTLTAANGPSIYMPGQTTLTISGGTLNGGIGIRMGTIKISGGEINATTNTKTIDSPKKYYTDSQCVWFPDAVFVLGGTYNTASADTNDLYMEITGGTFNCENGQGRAIAIYDLGKVEQKQVIHISDDAVLKTTTKDVNAYDVLSLADIGVETPAAGYGVYSGKITTEISGGTFSTAVDAKYCAEGYAPVALTEGDTTTYSVSNKKTVTVSARAAGVAEDKVGTVKIEPELIGAGIYTYGEPVTVTAETLEGWTFNGWYEGETRKSTSSAYTFTAVEDVALVAQYTHRSHTENQMTHACEVCGLPYYKVTFSGENYDTTTEYTTGAVEFPAGDYIFKDGENIIDTSDYTVDKDTEITVVKLVTEKYYAVTISASDGCTLSVRDGNGKDISNNDEVVEGTVLYVTAKLSAGYQWAANGEPKASYTVNEDTSITANAEKKKYTLTVTDNDANEAITVTVDDNEESLKGTDNTDNKGTLYSDIAYGSKVTVKAAVTNSDYEFLGWCQTNNTRLTTATEYTFVMTENTTVCPKYQAKEQKTVTFMSNNTVVKGLTVTDGASEITEKDLPEAKDVSALNGFEFAKWDKNVDEINTELKGNATNVVVKAVFTEIKNTFTVTVKNGENQQDKQIPCEQSTIITETAETVKDKNFAYWTLDGEIQSYNKKISFRATKDCTLEAVYTENVVEEKGMASLNTASYNAETKRLSIVSYLTVPGNAKMVQAGIYAASAASTKYNPNEELTADNADYVKKSTKLSSSQLTYTWIKTSVAIGDIWYARAYVVYELNGKTTTVMGERITINAGTDYDKTEKASAKINSATWNSDTERATFVAYLSIPEGGTMVKAGVVASGNYNPANDGLLTVDKNAQYVKTSTKLSNLQLIYTWTKTKVSQGDIWYVRPYVIYDINGVRHTVYGNLVKLQAN